MFGLMKMLRKEHYNTDERLSLTDLYIGCTVGFGFIPQRNLSGCRMMIRAVNTYTFGDETFSAYVLDDDQNDVNLIVTREDSGETHLSLSLRIEERLFPMLFLSHQPESWFNMNVGDKVETSERVMGMQQSWVAPSYRLAMISHGSVMEGDKKGTTRVSESVREFDYAILVDETNDHALEVEKYEDGTLVVYATVYRPSTDIGEISPPSQSYRYSNNNNVTPKLRIEDNEEEEVGDIITLTPDEAKPETEKVEVATEEAKEAAKEVAKEQADKAENKKEENKKESKKEAAKTEAAKTTKETAESAKTDTQSDSRNLIALDARFAVNVIKEAQKSNISIAALIRKVIDLPADINDQVLVDFALSDDEYANLAKRYNLESADVAGVKKNIVKELQQFVGNKK